MRLVVSRQFKISTFRLVIIRSQQHSVKKNHYFNAMTSSMPNQPLDIRDMRKPSYLNKDKTHILESDLPSNDPFTFFDIWFKEIAKNTEILFEEANACALSTATKDGKPSCRMILLKRYDNNGFHFFTNYNSRKGVELAENPNACILFYWAKPNRSIRIEGTVEKLPVEEGEDYWKRRPVDSQASAAISNQSQPVPSREYLEEKLDKIKANYKEIVPKPDHWGGYILKPRAFEFWQGQTDRLHDRIRFRLRRSDEETLEPETHEGEGHWVYERLAP